MICTEIDSFLKEYQERNQCWIVKLNSGLVVYQDDGRKNTVNSAWERLKEYCAENNDYIVDMSIGFRSNRHSLPSNADGYFFCKSAAGFFGCNKTIHSIVVGTLNDNILTVTTWKVPEMLNQSSEFRDPEKADICLIRKNINQSLEHQV